MTENIEYNFNITSAQIETLLGKIPEEGNVARVYQTTLILNDIWLRGNKAATQEEVDEVLNIIEKYKAGYIVTIAENKDYPFHYGVINVGMMDDSNPITLIHYNDVGDVMSYMLDAPQAGAMWTITNKITCGKYYLTTQGLLSNTDNDTFSLASADIAILESMRRTSNRLTNASVFYTGQDGSGNQCIVPLSFHADTEVDPFYANVSYTDPTSGKSYKFEINSNDDGSDYWASKNVEVSGGGGGGSAGYEKVTLAQYNAITSKEEKLYIIVG